MEQKKSDRDLSFLYRKMKSNEIQETWDADTTDSWDHLSLTEPPPQEETDAGSSKESVSSPPPSPQVALPRQIVISPLMESSSHHSVRERNQIHLESPQEEDLLRDVTIDDPSEVSSSTLGEEEPSEPERGRVNLFTTRQRLVEFSQALLANISPTNSLAGRKENKKKRFEPPQPPSGTLARRPSLIQSAPKRMFYYALVLWIFELMLVVTLKRVGVIEPDFRFNEVVAQKVLEATSSAWNRNNETGLLSPLATLVATFKLWGNESGLMQASLAYLTQETTRPGFQLAQAGAQAKYPLLIVPGFVTSGLEVWAGNECARKHFRQRMWAAMVGARSLLTDRDCWAEHMKLDPETGGDPENIRLRAASGFQAVDYFMYNYWVFGKVIENAADVGYSPSNFAVEPYDWRLGFPVLEERDGYFTQLKSRVEAMHQTNQEKVVITSHSMGVLVVHYFFSWVTRPKRLGGGGGGANWVDEHVHAYVNIAGSHLGVPKAVTSLLSGEMSDTILMNPMAQAVEQFFGRKLRRDLWTTWGSIWGMIPKGGDALWSDGSDMCNNTQSLTESNASDPFCPTGKAAQFLSLSVDEEVANEIADHEHVTLLTRRRNNLMLHNRHHRDNSHFNNLETDDNGISPRLRYLIGRNDFSFQNVVVFVKDLGGGIGAKLANAKMYSLYGSPSRPVANRDRKFAWHDPTQTPLPHAPNMKIYCMYGVGRLTERAYHYKLNQLEQQTQNGSFRNQTILLDPPLILDYGMSNPVRFSDGDGSVPLLSLGYICVDAWRRPSSGLNPSKTAVYTREYQHHGEFTVEDPMRSGPKSSDHVDILGNVDMTEDLLRILTDFEVEEKVNRNQIHSDIEGIAVRMHENGGGIFKRGNKKRRM